MHELPLEQREALGQLALQVMYPGFEVTPGSRREESDPIEVHEYDETWPERYEAWRGRLERALGQTCRRIEHVGSTAVPGLPAKPVIDVQISVDDLMAEDLYAPQLESLGVQLRSRDLAHRYFRPFSGRPRELHVHVCQVDSDWERTHLLFRDYLRASGAARRAYARAKRQAARLWSDDRVAYTDAKGSQILAIHEAAELWAEATGWTVAKANR